MYDFHDSTDTLKFWTEKWAISSDFNETCWNCKTHGLLQLHQVSSKSDEKQKSFIDSPFFCSKFQSVSRIVKIVHSAIIIRILGEDFFIVGKRKFTLKMMCTICQKWKLLQSFRQQFQTERFIIHGWIGVVQKLYIFLERLLHSFCSSSVCVWNFEIVCKKNEKKSRKIRRKENVD